MKRSLSSVAAMPKPRSSSKQFQASVGNIEIVSYRRQRLTSTRCQDEPGRECIPAMCD